MLQQRHVFQVRLLELHCAGKQYYFWCHPLLLLHHVSGNGLDYPVFYKHFLLMSRPHPNILILATSLLVRFPAINHIPIGIDIASRMKAHSHPLH